MPMSHTTGFDLPPVFDVASYDRVNEQAAVLANPNDASAPLKQNSWFSYAAAWNGFAARLRSAIEYDAEFGRLIAISTAPEQELRYLQERAFFGCIASAYSSIECFYMASYCLGTVLSQSNFPLHQALDLNKYPRHVATAFFNWLPTDSFSQLLSATECSSELRSLSNLRNTLAHRGVLPRKVNLSTGGDVPSAVPANPRALARDFDYNASLSSATTSVHTLWLGQIASRLTVALSEFLARCFQKNDA